MRVSAIGLVLILGCGVQREVNDEKVLADPPTSPEKITPLYVPPPDPPPAAVQTEVDLIEHGDWRDYYRQGLLLLNDHRDAEAVVALDACVSINLYAAKCHRALGIAHAKLHHGALAAQEYELFIVMDPKSPDAAEARRFLNEYRQGVSP